MQGSGLFVDHYAALKLEGGASLDEIKRSFRRLAKSHHPDISHDDGLKFLEIYTAYRILVDPDSRKDYDTIYLGRKNGDRARDLIYRQCIRIPSSRFVFPGSMAGLARKGLMRKSLRPRDRRIFLRIDYDLELPLHRDEMRKPIHVTIPLISRVICPECMGSDIHCDACNGKGSRKVADRISLLIAGGLIDGQVLELDLRKFKRSAHSHFKKSTIRIKISDKQ